MNFYIKKKWLRGVIITAITVPALILLNVYQNYEIKKQKIEKENQEWASWLSKLEDLECRNCGPHFKRIDSNGAYSYSCLQFQRATFVEMARKFGYKEQSKNPSWVEKNIYSCPLQKELARKIFEAEGTKAASHWHTSIFVKGLGLPPIEKDEETNKAI